MLKNKLDQEHSNSQELDKQQKIQSQYLILKNKDSSKKAYKVILIKWEQINKSGQAHMLK